MRLGKVKINCAVQQNACTSHAFFAMHNFLARRMGTSHLPPMARADPQDSAMLSPVLIGLFAVACGALVANLYYAQTLIDLIGPEIGLSDSMAGAITTLTQLGYGVGLLFVVPVGDLFENKRVVLVAVAGTVIGCIGIALSQGPVSFLAASLLTGICATGAQVLLPLATALSPRDRQGKVIGLVMSGLLTGIMLARPVASFGAHLLDWRAIFLISAGLCAVIWVALLAICPERMPRGEHSYWKTIASVVRNYRERRTLQLRSFYQAMLFMSFNLFWTAAPLELLRRFHFGQDGVGLFALAGAAGAAAAPLAGMAADRGRTWIASLLAMGLAAAAFLASGPLVAASSLAGFVAAALLIDGAVQVNQITGQKLIFALSEDARARINAAYMTVTFFLGAMGSLVATVTYKAGGWWASAMAGAAIAGLALAVFLLFDRGASRTD